MHLWIAWHDTTRSRMNFQLYFLQQAKRRYGACEMPKLASNLDKTKGQVKPVMVVWVIQDICNCKGWSISSSIIYVLNCIVYNTHSGYYSNRVNSWLQDFLTLKYTLYNGISQNSKIFFGCINSQRGIFSHNLEYFTVYLPKYVFSVN